ncbi:TIGR03089 family protein [Pseudonocardia spinosispora]|uniref:TIGR03089 family protein n=1 Tax=Pseudonocardia spinosispora TaxID=103441 RepID=UPI000413431E|nr:TIGR03089 family protein [Pseudonocardia spinosispora]
MSTSAATLTDALLGPILARDAARPLVTYYDDATGERIELSGTTLANWAAKTANLLRDECDLEPGGRVAVLLPAHWQTLSVLLGAWWCGAEVVSSAEGADVICCDADRLDVALAAGADVVVAFSLHAFGAGLPGLPAGVVDYATEVRLHGDLFTPEHGTAGDALDGSGVDDTLTAARKAADNAGLTDTARVLTTRDWSVEDGLLDVPLAVLAAGASLVQCRNTASGDALDRRADSERVTHRLS